MCFELEASSSWGRRLYVQAGMICYMPTVSEVLQDGVQAGMICYMPIVSEVLQDGVQAGMICYMPTVSEVLQDGVNPRVRNI
jgi:hypothetical protein